MRYWERRAREREAHWQDKASEVLNEEIKRYYAKSLTEIEREIAALYGRYGTENGIRPEQVRKAIRGAEYRRWRMSLEEYVEAGKSDAAILKELNALSLKTRITRLEMLHARTLIELSELARQVENSAESLLLKVYEESLYGSLYDYGRSIGLTAVPAAVSAKQLEHVLREKWQGGNYSSRIWRDTLRLEGELQTTLLKAIHRGQSVQRLSKDLDRRMKAGYSNCERLVRTEVNYVQNRANLAAIREAGFTHYKYCAAAGARTCSRCSALNGRIFEVTEAEQGLNFPPIHPRCRCTTIADFGEIKANRRIVFDAQRFSVYDDQVRAHGGSGQIKADVEHDSHSGNPRRARPYQIIDHKDRTGKVDKRAFYDATGVIYLEIHTTNHGFPKAHPFGEKGEHAHDMQQLNDKVIRPNAGRELSETERKDSEDIL